jgi:enolase
MGVDIAANSILSNKKYVVKDKNGQLDQDDLIELYQNLINDFSLVYLEDPFAEDDWEGWKKAFAAFASKTLISTFSGCPYLSSETEIAWSSMTTLSCDK